MFIRGFPPAPKRESVLVVLTSIVWVLLLRSSGGVLHLGPVYAYLKFRSFVSNPKNKENPKP